MAVLRLNVALDVTNATVPDFPLAARREFSRLGAFETEVADGVTESVPTPNVETLQALVLQTDVATAVDLGTITLAPGGFIVIFNGTPSTSPVTVTPDGDTATIRGIAFGA